jgi:HEAT repeat protein
MDSKYLEGLSLDIAPETIDYQVETAGNFLEDLKAASAEVRVRAIKKIKQVAYNVKKLLDRRFVKSLLEAFMANQEEEFRVDILVTVGFIGDASALPFLRKVLSESSDYGLKKACAFALGEMRFAGSAQSLIEAIEFDDEELQLIIINALSKISDPATAPALLEACKNASLKVKITACGFLCKLGVTQGFEFIRRGLAHNSDDVKKEALVVARDYPHELFLAPLHEILVSVHSAEILVACIDALSKINDTSVVEDITKHVDNEEHAEVRAAAVKALGELGELCKLLTDDITPYVKKIAGRLKDGDENVVINAALALGELKLPEVIPDLLDIIDSPSEKVRTAVVTAVRSLAFWLSDIDGKNRLTYALMSLAKDPSPLIRSIVIETLGYLENGESLEVLLEALADESNQVRENATAALGNFSAPNVIEALVNLLSDDNVVIRWNAVTALNRIGDKGCLGPISRLLEDSDESVRLAAKAFVDSFPTDPQ